MNTLSTGPLSIGCCITVAVLAVPILWLVATYNRFARLSQHVRESWSGVDVELKRRHDLVPNLVETVRGYATHEREALESVVAARSHALQAGDELRARVAGEVELGRSLQRLLAIAEAYPDLKADRHFLELQRELSLTEDRIAAARRFYNANVREINGLAVAVPSNIVASVFGFTEQRFFELVDGTERASPSVRM